MLCGTYFCSIHQVPLCIVNVAEQKYGTRFLFLPDSGESQSFTVLQTDKLLFIAEQIASLANSHLTYKVASNSYLPLLCEAGLTTQAGHIRIRNLEECVGKWIHPIRKFYPFNKLYEALSIERSWVANVVAGRGEMHHPLKHIVLWGALESDLYTLSQYIDVRYSQLSLRLFEKTDKQFTEEQIRDALVEHRTASSAAKFLNCSTTTLLVGMRKYGIPFKGKPKILTDVIINSVLDLLASGKSAAEVARASKLSVSTVNRLKRAYLQTQHSSKETL